MAEYDFIKSKLTDLVLEVANGKMKNGTPVCTEQRKGIDAQKWRTDNGTKTIRTKLNDFCLDIEDGKLVINSYVQGRDEQKWEPNNEKIVNGFDKQVLQVDGDFPGARVSKVADAGSSKQSWVFERAD